MKVDWKIVTSIVVAVAVIAVINGIVAALRKPAS